MNDYGLNHWQVYLEALQRTEQYVLNSLKLIQYDISCCKRRIESCKNGGPTISDALNYRPYEY